MKRFNYLNGDPIQLTAGGCDGCEVASINRVLCHEHGCPYAWRDTIRECRLCGDEFRPIHHLQTTCGACNEF